MKTDDAKKILSFYRPGTADMGDPEFAEALELVRRAKGQAADTANDDQELAQWFDAHCARYTAGRAKFQQIALPAALREQILAERNVISLPVVKKRNWLTSPAFLAMAAAVVALLCILPFALRPPKPFVPVTDFEKCRDQMVKAALAPYSMDLQSTNEDKVRSYLAERSAPANYAIPKKMPVEGLLGCAVKSWNNTPASMICFRSGPPGGGIDLWLFILDSKSLRDAPVAEKPEFAQINRGATASWTVGDRTYILVGEGDRKFLEQYL
jgi:hypothetical protein